MWKCLSDNLRLEFQNSVRAGAGSGEAEASRKPEKPITRVCQYNNLQRCIFLKNYQNQECDDSSRNIVRRVIALFTRLLLKSLSQRHHHYHVKPQALLKIKMFKRMKRTPNNLPNCRRTPRKRGRFTSLHNKTMTMKTRHLGTNKLLSVLKEQILLLVLPVKLERRNSRRANEPQIAFNGPSRRNQGVRSLIFDERGIDFLMQCCSKTRG